MNDGIGSSGGRPLTSAAPTEPSPASPSKRDSTARLVVDGGALCVWGVPDARHTRLYLEGVLGAERVDGGWRLPPSSRSLEDLSIHVNRWLTARGITPVLEGLVDVSVQRDAERLLSFARAQAAGERSRAGSLVMSQEAFSSLLAEAGWNFEGRRLRPHQIQAAIHSVAAANAANFSVPGAGKTATTLATAAVHVAAGAVDVVVVIGPLSSFAPWETETATCLPEWQVSRLSGSATERRRRIRSAGRGQVLLSSYPGAVSDNAALRDLCRTQRVMLVADESHRIKRFSGGQWAEAVLALAAVASVRVVLSGTPMPQSGLDLYTQMNVLWPGRELTGDRSNFKSQVDKRFGTVVERVLPFVSRTSKTELGLPAYSVEVVDVSLGPGEAEVYDLLRAHLRRAVEAVAPTDAERLAALRRGRPMRLLQAASNAAMLADGAHVRASEGATPTLLSRIAEFDHSRAVPAKFEAAAELLRAMGPDEKSVVWTNYIRNLDSFARYVTEVTDIAVFQVDGRVPARPITAESDASDDDESREAVIAGFLRHPGKAVLVTNPASCSESISLHSACRNAIYLDRTYDCAQWLQSIDRIHRLGLPPDAQVRVHVLRATLSGEPTIDHLVAASLAGKESRMMQLLEGAALSPIHAEPDDAEGTIDDLRQLIVYLLGQDG